MMNDLKTAFRHESDSWKPPEGDFGTVRREGIRRIRRKRFLVATASALCSVVVTVFLIDGIGRWWNVDDSTSDRADIASGEWSTRQDEDSGLFISESKIAASTFEVEVSDGSVWLLACMQACRQDSAHELLRVDPATGSIDASTGVEGATDITIAHGSVWVVNFDDDAVLRLDTDTLAVEAVIELPVPQGSQFKDERYLPTHIIADTDHVWVDSNRGFLTRIDAANNEVSGSFRVADVGPAEMVATRQDLWLTGSVDGVLVVDPDSGRPERYDQVRAGDGELVAESADGDEDAVWIAGNIAVNESGDYVSTERGALARLDADSGATLEVREVPHTAQIRVDGTTVWAIDGLGRVWQLDASGRPLTEEPVPIAEGPDAIDAALDAAWIARQDGTLVRVSNSRP